MKRFFLILAFFAWTFTAVAQETKIPQRLEIVTIDLNPDDDDAILSVDEQIEVFCIPEDGVNHYFLSVGHLGIGDEIVQVNFNPLFELFIPLGDTLAEAQESLQELQALYKGPRGKTFETEGCLSVGFPNDKLEPVTVTYRKVLLSNLLEFSVKRGDYVRATHINKSQFNALVSGVKFYRKLHPNEL